MNKRTQIALFDFDGTLIQGDTLFSFALFCRGNKQTLKAIVRTLPYLILGKLGLLSLDKAKESLFYRLYNGLDFETFKQKGIEFAPILDRKARKEILHQAQLFQKAGVKTIIVSASITEWIEPWAIQNGFSAVIATRAQIDMETHTLTGHFATPNCNREEKVSRIFSSIPDIQQYEIWAYGNSRNDDAMLALADFPHKV